jgi:hypothetical protein
MRACVAALISGQASHHPQRCVSAKRYSIDDAAIFPITRDGSLAKLHLC